MAEYTPDPWDELQREADLLKLHITLGQLRAKHIELTGPPAEPWDNARVAKQRRKKWAAVDERAKASRALSRLLGRSA